MARLHEKRTINPGTLDLAHLRRYTLGNAALEAELLSLFSAQIPVLMNRIESGSVGDDWQLAVHTLKGSARAVGAICIADLAAALEEADPAGPGETRDRLIKRLGMAVINFAAEAQKFAS
jgi:HPt (histidine-containing phosphotransfer) domain-containing protein